LIAKHIADKVLEPKRAQVFSFSKYVKNQSTLQALGRQNLHGKNDASWSKFKIEFKMVITASEIDSAANN